MNHYLTPEERAACQSLADKARQIATLMGELVVEAITSEHLTTEERLAVLEWDKRAENYKGFAYFLTPQSEWTGGDSSDPKNTKFRKPHLFTNIK